MENKNQVVSCFFELNGERNQKYKIVLGGFNQDKHDKADRCLCNLLSSLSFTVTNTFYSRHAQHHRHTQTDKHTYTLPTTITKHDHPTILDFIFPFCPVQAGVARSVVAVNVVEAIFIVISEANCLYRRIGRRKGTFFVCSSRIC